MKKVFIICVIVGICLLTYNVFIKPIGRQIDAYKEKVEKYADLLKGDLADLDDDEFGELEDLITGDSPQEVKVVRCEREYLTSDKILVLYNCTIKNTDTKYCYYKDTAYECNDETFKNLYENVAK